MNYIFYFSIGFNYLSSKNFNFSICSKVFSNNKNSEAVSKNTSTTSEKSDEEYEDEIKTNILNESLKFVSQYGWSKEAISAGAQSINYPGIIHGLFPNSGVDLIHHFNVTCNTKLKEKIQDYFEETSSKAMHNEALAVEELIHTRLEMIIPYKKNWPQALALMSLPQNIPLSLINITTLVDNIYFYCGHNSVNMDWYGKRIALATIYKITELYMLQDKSDNHNQTWRFLNTRIKHAYEISEIASPLINTPKPEEIALKGKVLFTAMICTTQNIIGLNWKKYE